MRSGQAIAVLGVPITAVFLGGYLLRDYLDRTPNAHFNSLPPAYTAPLLNTHDDAAVHKAESLNAPVAIVPDKPSEVTSNAFVPRSKLGNTTLDGLLKTIEKEAPIFENLDDSRVSYDEALKNPQMRTQHVTSLVKGRIPNFIGSIEYLDSRRYIEVMNSNGVPLRLGIMPIQVIIHDTHDGSIKSNVYVLDTLYPGTASLYPELHKDIESIIKNWLINYAFRNAEYYASEVINHKLSSQDGAVLTYSKNDFTDEKGVFDFNFYFQAMSLFGIESMVGENKKNSSVRSAIERLNSGEPPKRNPFLALYTMWMEADASGRYEYMVKGYSQSPSPKLRATAERLRNELDPQIIFK